MSAVRTVRIPLCAALLTLTAWASSTAPVAADPGADEPRHSAGSVRITPPKVKAGGEVNIRVDSCDGDKAIARSEAFVASVALRPAADDTLSGDASVRRKIEPGTYAVLVDCYDKRGDLQRSIAQGRLVVVGGEKPVPPEPVHPVKPTAPVKAGGGGTADGAGPTAGLTGGLTLLALFGLAGAAVMRRRKAAARHGGAD
ncbi:hypothetical protein GL263_07930 [Streptomyces durbertensis]|uniref:Uncharacterized protein n=1 Tax=Streptomyces durbertensis TaxID=2448886 RepID=A0ABR6EE06_9ACTN|nr:hypothetical protein [Streptomyces durbertensis]MBB1243488.1 hypothetical protein [Streptomyces durbertensis]